MLVGAHTLGYVTDPDAARVLFRGVLGWAPLDAGDGWLIFRCPSAELAVHAADPVETGRCAL
ncbi:hypothetical protein [Nocardia pseudobrasiliensis]|uniref:Glyoxalase/bleomycin resistance protein/dioxygenase superfamily protein n=1 Tax=Nocardia pseudobrasiliensis TaxID=45979 RepID=A0A370HYC8_9NOCA|nr:hypothetical protein [Nocardia pseudobrasiliensis]RDI63516.1 hypothetical protein DFR76_110213 [Nocardia pseudobrasiliensis]